MERLPSTVTKLIEELNKAYPHRCPTLKESEREIFYKAGQRSVVDFLQRLLNEANENILKEKIDV